MLRRPRSFLLTGLIAILILTPALTLAQDDEIPPLTETMTVVEFNLDFQAPAGWEPPFGEGEGNGTVFLFSAPIGGTGAANAEGFAVEGGATVIFMSFEASDESAEAAALRAAQEFDADGSTFELGELQHLNVNGREGAQVDITSIVFLNRYIGMEVEGGIVVTVEILGFEEGVSRTTPIVLAMLATVRESGAPLPDAPPVIAPALTQAYTRAVDQTNFSAPGDWLIEETDNFTLLTAPNGVTVGISSEAIPDLDDIVLDTIAVISDNLEFQLPEVKLDLVQEFEVNGQRAALVSGTDSGISFEFWAIDLGDGVVGHISVIGPPEDVRELGATLFAIAETITSGEPMSVSPPQEVTLDASITSDDGSFTISYPASWSAELVDDFVAFTSDSTDLLVVVQNGLEYIELGTGITVPETADPSTITRAIVQNAEENGYPENIEKLTINDRAASLLYGTEEGQERYVLIFTLADGSLANMTALTPAGQLDALSDLLLEIAASMSLR